MVFKILFVNIGDIMVVDDKITIVVDKVVLRDLLLDIKQISVDTLEAKVLLNDLLLSDKFRMKASLLDIKTRASNSTRERNITDHGLDIDLGVVSLLIEGKIEIKTIKIDFVTLTQFNAILELKQNTTKLKLKSNILIKTTKIILPKIDKPSKNEKISGINLRNILFLKSLLCVLNVHFSLILKNVVLQYDLFKFELKQITFDINTLDTIQISIDLNRLYAKISTNEYNENEKFQDSNENDILKNVHLSFSSLKERSEDESDSEDDFTETLNTLVFVPTARFSTTFDLSKMLVESSLFFSIIDIRVKQLVEHLDQILKEYVHYSNGVKVGSGNASDINTAITTTGNMKNQKESVCSNDIYIESHETDSLFDVDSKKNVVLNCNLMIDFEELKISVEQSGFETLLQILGGHSSITLNYSHSNRKERSVFDSLLIDGGIKEFNLLGLKRADLKEIELKKYVFKTKDIQLHKKPAELIEISSSPINIDFSLSIFYILTKSFESIFISLNKADSKISIPILPIKKLDFESDNIDIDLKDFPVLFDMKLVFNVPVINLEFHLTENIKTLTKFTNATLQFNQKMFLFADLLEIYIYKPEKSLLLQMSNIKSIFEKKDEMDIRIDTDKVNIQVPYDYGLYNIVENLLNYIKGSKRVYRETFKIPLEAKFELGRTFCEAITIPSLKFRSKILKLTVDDDMFEGYEENQNRINRALEFNRKIKILYPTLTIAEMNNIKKCILKNRRPKTKIEKEVTKAYEYLQIFNSMSFLHLIKQNNDIPKLMEMEICEFFASVETPGLDRSIEETCVLIDDTTPDNMKYDDLLCLSVKTCVKGMKVCLRDYSIPLIQVIYIDQVSKETECKLESLVIIADPCSEFKLIELEILKSTNIAIKKSIAPTKFYVESKSKIVTDDDIEICVGAAYEPCLADLINIIDNFTKSQTYGDPIGWWDKLRLIYHGRNKFKFSGKGNVVLKILGSISPRFNPRINSGIQGLDVIMGDGLDVLFGGQANCGMVLNCGQVKVSLPRQSGNQSSMACFAKLSGGVKLSIQTEFFTKNNMGEISIPFVNHHMVSMDDKEGTVKDLFYGFRSFSIKIKIDVHSPREYYSGLGSPQNVLFLNNDTLGGIDQLLDVYQSLLTNVPIRRGVLFDSNRDLKPKLNRMINEVNLNAILRPLVLSFILECEDMLEVVGVRLRAEEMKVDVSFKQYELDLKEKIIDRKQVTKWIRLENYMSFLEIEARVLSYSEADSDLHIPKPKCEKDFIGWIFNEDMFLDLSKLSIKSCAWSPKVDYLHINNDSTRRSNYNLSFAVYQIQFRILKMRLRDLESTIYIVIQKLASLESRAHIFFDEATQSKVKRLKKELMMLKAQQETIKQEILECERMINPHNKPSEVNDHYKTSSEYDSKYFIHDVKILWTEHVRNIIFRLVEINSNNRALSYCLSNAAAQVTAQLIARMNQGQDHGPVPNIKISKKTTEKEFKSIIDGLLNDLEQGINFTVPCEVDSSKDSPSKRPSKLVRVNNHYMDREVLFQFINPQVKFEFQGVNGVNSAVICARKIQIENLLEVDSETKIFDLARENVDRIINFRDTWGFDKAQFFIENKDTINYADYKTGGYFWVPIECVINDTLNNTRFSRIMGQSEVIYKQRKSNPLYKNQKVESHSTYHFKIPNVSISATSNEYLVLYDLFKNLLVYQDPRSGERSDRLKKMIFTLQQSDDLKYYRDSVSLLQSKIRQANYLLAYGKKNDVRLSPNECELATKSRAAYKNELFVLIEGILNLKALETKKQSLDISWKLMVDFNHVEWLMLQDNYKPLCSWTVENLDYSWTNKEDQSSINILEIDAINLENLIEPCVFRTVFSAYNPNGMANTEFQKALRVLWRENAPVAGIQVVEHFEINVHPLMIQITYDFGVQLSAYIFPAQLKSDTKIQSPIPDNKNKQEIVERREESSQLKQMRERAGRNLSFVYIKVPGVQHCLSYRRSQEKNFEDLEGFSFLLPNLEYRNKTWTWFDLLQAVKVDAFKAALANTGALVKEKLFQKKKHLKSEEKLREFDNESLIDDMDASATLKSTSASDYFKRAFVSKKSSNLSATASPRVSITVSPRDSTTASPRSSMTFNPAKLTESIINGSLGSIGSLNKKSPTESLLTKGKLIFGKHFNLPYQSDGTVHINSTNGPACSSPNSLEHYSNANA